MDIHDLHPVGLPSNIEVPFHPFHPPLPDEVRNANRRLLQHQQPQAQAPKLLNPPPVRLPIPPLDRAKALLESETSASPYPPYQWICFACGMYHFCALPDVHMKETRKKDARIEDAFTCSLFEKEFPEYITLGGKRRTWLTFHLIARALRHGRTFELPWFPDVSRADGRRKLGRDIRVKVVGGRLLVRDRYWGGIGVGKERRQRMGSFHHLCPHLKDSGITNADYDRVLNGAVAHLRKHYRQENGGGFVFKTYRCTSCPTEITLEVCCISLFDGEIGKRARKKGYVLSLSCYRDFGTCMAPDEMEWRALSTWYKRPGDSHKTSYKDSSKWVPKCARDDALVPMHVRPRIDVTGPEWESISSRFEGPDWTQLPLLPGHGAPWMAPPEYKP
ncbi:hypothetical protein BDV96DRAFT_605915 [Lophiotrema nucula]|uniref:Uncharacterized protein n=1 Tax=Lophiotrema nucula TaxID=690887 RepID=A0A6A5YLT8_9PLEO|nr:hypothetical protein BDV96DRAFT_605915 [Lophiotrema nucula]